ncbi:MAG: DoxX family protein [Bacteroidota bacterium]
MTSQNKSSKFLNIFLWTAQIVLGAMFLMAGIMKSTQPLEELGKSLPWVNDVGLFTRFIGIVELLGSIGLILPSLLRIKPILTPLAAFGLFIIMVLALVYHITRGEYEALGINLILAAIALFIVWGRYKKVPVLPKV